MSKHYAHLSIAFHFYHVSFGIVLWYPLPFMRRVPISMAKALGTGTKW